MARATTRRLTSWLTLSLLTLVLALPSGVLAQAVGHWELKPDFCQLDDDKDDGPVKWEGKEVGRYSWAATGPNFAFKLHIDHSNGLKTDLQTAWTITGLPGKQLTPGEKIRIVAKGTASGNPDSFDKNSDAQCNGGHEGLLGERRGATATVGFVDQELVTSAQWVVEGTVPGEGPEQISISASAACVWTQQRGLYLHYVYTWVPGPAKPTIPQPAAKPTAPKPAPKPIVMPPRPGPSKRSMLDLSIHLATSKSYPKELLNAFILISSGLKHGETTSGNLELTVYRDNSGAQLAAVLIAQQMYVPASASLSSDGGALSSQSERIVMNGPATSLSTSPKWVLWAPLREGEYRLQASLTTDDNRMANASVPFNVVANARRLVVGPLCVGDMAAGESCPISISFSAEGLATPGAPQPGARVSGSVQGVRTAGSAEFFARDLPEREVQLRRISDKEVTGTAVWLVVFPRPGTYRVSCQIYVPQYGSADREATITVTGQGAVAGGAENLIATALGNRASAAGQAGGEGAATTGGTTATTGAATGTTVGVATTAGGPAGNGGGGGKAVTTGGGGANQNAATTDLRVLPTVGMTLAIQDGGAVVRVVEEGSLADQAGIKPGARLLAIDDKPTKGLTMEQIRQLLTPQGDKELVSLTLADMDGNEWQVPLMAVRK
jgi:hypothetical protein